MAKSAKRRRLEDAGFMGMGGFLDGLGTFLERLGELAETGEQLRRTGEFQGPEGKVRGVYGFNIKVGLGDEAIKVEPFGNVGEDAETGRAVVTEVREPMADVFDEEDCVLVVLEMPGVGQEDVHVDLRDDILTVTADREDKRYRKELLLPATCSVDKMKQTCRNGVLEVRFEK